MHFCGFNYEQHSHRMTGNKVMTDHQILYLSILSFLFHFLRQTHYVVQDGSELIFFLPLQECATMPILKHSFSNNPQTLRKFLSNLKSQSTWPLSLAKEEMQGAQLLPFCSLRVRRLQRLCGPLPHTARSSVLVTWLCVSQHRKQEELEQCSSEEVNI